MQQFINPYLVIGAALSALAGLVHIGCIVFGAPWYRFLGAGGVMIQMVETGHWYPPVFTAAIAATLFAFSAYALSAAGAIRRLPLLKLVLCTIASIYLLRGLCFFVLIPLFPENGILFWIISSAICLVLGLVHFVGVRQTWGRL
ncbi:hypothetical protein D5038_05560 [Verminephrobacter aporrectodeae subsp. tuberculatae]|uniref:hypothetical protein n=1 Tax=Verminephrobacter aporrectodeae TaxID=1110389 RepID=UPI0022390E0B|nr:hypothetical protein [Verminephrobacter aporrectodeae]MCW5255838.1 hypothetical protein [Verminephrobacter aporrectodeae subsp. tuberculatae]